MLRAASRQDRKRQWRDGSAWRGACPAEAALLSSSLVFAGWLWRLLFPESVSLAPCSWYKTGNGVSWLRIQGRCWAPVVLPAELRTPRAALTTTLHEDKRENRPLAPSSGVRPAVCSLCPTAIVSGWVEGALLECQADWQRFLPGLHQLLFFYLATHSSSLQMFQVSWFIDPGPRSQKSCFPHPWTDSHWTWSSNYARSEAAILWLRIDGVFSSPSSPAPSWCCFRRSHEHIVVLASFYLSWLKRQTISVCFYSIFQVLYRVPINKILCLENVRAWKEVQFNQQQAWYPGLLADVLGILNFVLENDSQAPKWH